MTNNVIFTRPSELIGEISGLITLPSDYRQGEEKLPVIVFLHGAGERGANDEDMVSRLMTHGIPKYFGKDCNYNNLRVITISPECPVGFIWDHIIFQLKKWIDEAVDYFSGDKSKISVTGLSMGGFGTWNLICTFPGYYFRSAPICGGGTSWRCSALKNEHIRAFHSVDDPDVPFTDSMKMVEVARRFGADVTLTAFDKVGHGSWVNAYEKTDLIEWLAGAV